MMRRVWLALGAVIAAVLLAGVTLRLLPQGNGTAGAYAVPQVRRVYSVTQFVQPVVGPLWTTRRKTVFLIHGYLRRVALQPVADYLLSDRGATGTGSGCLALASPGHTSLLSLLLGVEILRPWLPHSSENPVLATPATYRVLWTGCPASGCSRSPWQLISGGE